MITPAEAAMIREVDRELADERRAAEAARRAEEEEMHQVMLADVQVGYDAIEMVLRDREPLERGQARQLLRTGKRLSDAVATLQPLGRHRRVARVRHLVGLAMTLAQWQQRWPR